MTKAESKISSSSKSMTRKQKFKDLMRNRTTVEQGLTFNQIFCEVYSDVVEKYTYRNPDLGRSELDLYRGNILSLMDYEGQYGKIRYLKRMIKQVRKKDDEFRWLSIMPVKRNEVDKTTGRKVRPYLDYKYINIKASKTPELLEQANKIWAKHAEACIKGLERKGQRLRALIERTSTKEGQREHMISLEALYEEIDLTLHYCNIHNTLELDKIISELKDEGRLPRKYRTNYDAISKILRREIANKEILRHTMRQMPDVILYDKNKRKEEIRKTIKDIIVCSILAYTMEQI